MTRLRSGLLLPYHLGRLTTYGALGAVAALSGQTLSGLSWFHFISAALLAFAAGLFFWQAFFLSASSAISGSASLWSHVVARFAADMSGPGFLNGYGLGLLLGFIPCGLVYAALAVSAASADPLAGATGMLAFGLGTIPMLIGIGIIGQMAMTRMKRFSGLARPVIMALNGGMLLFIAANWGLT